MIGSRTKKARPSRQQRRQYRTKAEASISAKAGRTTVDEIAPNIQALLDSLSSTTESQVKAKPHQ